jgi:hypothetical protein
MWCQQAGNGQPLRQHRRRVAQCKTSEADDEASRRRGLEKKLPRNLADSAASSDGWLLWATSMKWNPACLTTGTGASPKMRCFHWTCKRYHYYYQHYYLLCMYLLASQCHLAQDGTRDVQYKDVHAQHCRNEVLNKAARAARALFVSTEAQTLKPAHLCQRIRDGLCVH